MANETPPLHLFAETTKFTTWPVTPRYLRQDAPSSCPAVRGLRCQGMLLVRQATTHKGAPEFSTLALDDEAMRAHNVADGTARVGSRAAPRLGFGGLLHLMAGSPLPLLRGHRPRPWYGSSRAPPRAGPTPSQARLSRSTVPWAITSSPGGAARSRDLRAANRVENYSIAVSNCRKHFVTA